MLDIAGTWLSAEDRHLLRQPEVGGLVLFARNIQRPQQAGIAVPGMPIGSPGMEVGDRVDSYQTLLFDQEGKTSAFSRHGTPSAVPHTPAVEILPPPS